MKNPYPTIRDHGDGDAVRHVADKFGVTEDLLFSHDASNLEIITLRASMANSAEEQRVSLEIPQQLEDLNLNLGEEGESPPLMKIILVPQEYSWGRLSITSTIFESIVCKWQVCAGFFDVLGAYGVKSRESERAFYGLRMCNRRRQCHEARQELCYNVPYVEKHGRDLRDPWSMRQIGLYYQHLQETSVTRWILLNVTTRIRSALTQFLANPSQCCFAELHTSLLTMLERNWTLYLEDLTDALLEQDDKACYSGIDHRKDRGFTVTFHDLQKLHMLRAKINRATVAVDACGEIGRGCLQHFGTDGSQSRRSGRPCLTCISNMTTYIANMVRHGKALRRLDQSLQETLDLIAKILMFRNEALLQTFNRHSSDTLDALVAINQQSRFHQETLTSLFGQVQTDSVLLKMLSIVATVYLPASLVATVFSSNLIQSSGAEIPQHATHLVLSPQFWTYIAISVPLMVLTLVGTLYFDRVSQRKAAATKTADHGLTPATPSGVP